MLKNKNGFQVNISLSIFFIAFCDLFTDFPSYEKLKYVTHLYILQKKNYLNKSCIFFKDVSRATIGHYTKQCQCWLHLVSS
jgi:hypothetical protein